MNNVTDEYDRLAYKKYVAYCDLERQEFWEKHPHADLDFQVMSFEKFKQTLDENPEFARVWGYWNFV
jgi:hypothetical protein